MSTNVKRLLFVAVIALVLYLLLSQPQASAGWVKDALNWLKNAAEQIVTFFKDIFK